MNVNFNVVLKSITVPLESRTNSFHFLFIYVLEQTGDLNPDTENCVCVCGVCVWGGEGVKGHLFPTLDILRLYLGLDLCYF